MEKSFWHLCEQLKKGKFVDLTHPFDPHIPHFEKTVPMEMETVRNIEEHGYLVQRFHLEGQWGTHVDAPSHFFQGGRTLDEITVKEMLLPLVVIDLHDKVAKDCDYIITLQDLYNWEKLHGAIPENSFVALRSDWSHRWPDNEKMYNRDKDGIAHTPGWSLECLRYLYEERKITANGHETIDPDAGIRGPSTGYECERYILNRDKYQIEMMTNLDQCPEYGALAIAAFPKAKGASGFPVRIFAICPA